MVRDSSKKKNGTESDLRHESNQYGTVSMLGYTIVNQVSSNANWYTSILVENRQTGLVLPFTNDFHTFICRS